MSSGGGGDSGSAKALVTIGASVYEHQRGLIRLAKVTNHKYLQYVSNGYGKRGESWSKIILSVRRGECDYGDWVAVAVGSNGERDSYIYLLNKGDYSSRSRVCESLRLLEEAKALLASTTVNPNFLKVYNLVDGLFTVFYRVLDSGAKDDDFDSLKADIDVLRFYYGSHLVDLAIVAWYLDHGHHMPLVFVIDDYMVLHSRLPDYIIATKCIYELCLGWVA
jgi:hypothetical protein